MAIPNTGKVTFFTTCKPFTGGAAILQRNALLTWQKLGLKIIICGPEDGATEAAADFGAKHIPDIETNDKGTPLIRGIFSKAAQACDTPFLAYINADILLTPSVVASVAAFLDGRSAQNPFLMTMRRRNIPLGGALETEGDKWLDQLNRLDQKFGSWDQSNAIDLFLFSRDLFGDIIPLVVGHMQWDNWLLWRAHTLGADIIDGSLNSALLHPIHGYVSDGTGLNERTQGAQAVKNRQLAAGNSMTLTTATTHILHGGETLPLSEKLKARLEATCQPNAAKEFWAGLKYLGYAKDRCTMVELLDCCRTILWRFERFFPVFENALPTGDQFNRMVPAALDAGERSDLDSAANAVQDLVCTGFLDRLRAIATSGRPIFIWGCGTAGLRMASCLKRHQINVSGFLDRDGAKTGTNVGGLMVVGSDISEADAGAKPYLLIASMHASEIAAGFETRGLEKHQDFTG